MTHNHLIKSTKIATYWDFFFFFFGCGELQVTQKINCRITEFWKSSPTLLKTMPAQIKGSCSWAENQVAIQEEQMLILQLPRNYWLSRHKMGENLMTQQFCRNGILTHWCFVVCEMYEVILLLLIVQQILCWVHQMLALSFQEDDGVAGECSEQ